MVVLQLDVLAKPQVALNDRVDATIVQDPVDASWEHCSTNTFDTPSQKNGVLKVCVFNPNTGA